MLTIATLVILSLSAFFVLNVIACAVALGRMHAWLKENNEVFGDGLGLVNAIVIKLRKTG